MVKRIGTVPPVMKAFMRTGEAARYLAVSTRTIRRWDKAGKLVCHRTPGGHRRIALVELERVLHGQEQVPNARKTAVYSRVSSHEQKKRGDLQRQVEAGKKYCQRRGYLTGPVYTDVASGLNTARRGLQGLCRAIERGEIDRVVVTYRDRLTRFGFDYLARYFASHGATVEAVEGRVAPSFEEELVQDLIAIVTSFSGRVHGLRSSRARRSRQQERTGTRIKEVFPDQATGSDTVKG